MLKVFQRKKMRKGAVIQGIVDVPDSGGGQDYKDFARLHELFSNHGDYELTMDGIHENILQMRYHDASLQKTVEALEWMGDSDMFGQSIQSKQHYFLLAYQPSMELLIRRLVAQEERPQIEWPRSYQRFRLDRAVKKEMISSWLAAMVASVSRSVSPASLAQDIVTPLLSILSPPTLRPVASHLLNPNEKEEMVQLVDTMLAFGLLYKHSKPSHFTSKTVYGGELQGVLVLDPPIDSLVKFKVGLLLHYSMVFSENGSPWAMPFWCNLVLY
jgi:chromosome transmission fidelity protein 18